MTAEKEPTREDSFQSVANMSDPSPPKGGATLRDTDLVRENDRLRDELEKLHAKIDDLQGKLRRRKTRSTTEVHQGPEPTSKLVVELPKTLKGEKNARSRPPSCFPNRRALKEEHSVATEDDQETIEPPIDLEAHESGVGLHHRSLSYLAQQKAPLTQQQRTSSKAKEATIIGHDDSLTASSGFNDDEDENDEADTLLHNSQHEAVSREIHQEESFLRIIQDRAGWLVGLLVLQSMSSFILARNEELLQEHLVIIRFLTMLVGAGGNAGNQASVRGKFGPCPIL